MCPAASWPCPHVRRGSLLLLLALLLLALLLLALLLLALLVHQHS